MVSPFYFAIYTYAKYWKGIAVRDEINKTSSGLAIMERRRPACIMDRGRPVRNLIK